MTAGERWRLGHRPGLDGLRGLAISFVLVCHFDRGQFTGAGGIGVTLFFTLSGFLITSGLLQEHEATGRIDLVAFYRRRACRLLPALTAVVGVCVVVGQTVPTGLSAGMIASVLLYASNFFAIAHHGAINALSQTWTLAIEEQFYLIWPLAAGFAAARYGRRGVMCVAGGGALLSATERAVLYFDGANPVRIGYSSDTRADALLLGCLLAALMTGRGEGATAPVKAAACLVLVLPLTLSLGPIGDVLLVPTVTAMASVGTIFYATQMGEVAWLRWPPLTWLGRRSYGVYIWHFPLIVITWPQLAPLGWFVQTSVVLSASLLIAEASWRWLEAPIIQWNKTRLRVRRLELMRPSHPLERAPS